MEEKAIPITLEGKQGLEEELNFLINVRRREIAEKIHSAKQDGDISENAGYDAAKEEQSIVEGRINYVQAMLQRVVLIENTGRSDKISLGSRVTVRADDCDEWETYSIVGQAEADPVEGRISNESPLGKALIGKKNGDKVTIKAPAGEMCFHIIEVQ